MGATRQLRLDCTRRTWFALRAGSSAKSLKDLGSPLGNRLGALGGDRKGQHSIRINDQYRICFEWTEAGPAQVEVSDYPG